LKLSLPASVSAPDAKGRFTAWLSEVETKIESLRASRTGEAQGLTHKNARALSGAWYKWFTARHESEPGKADWEFELLISPLVDGKLANLEPELLACVEKRARVPAFLAERGLNLTADARSRFLDLVAQDYDEAVRLLQRRASGDYTPDARPAQFPAFERRSKAVSPWALFEQWAGESKPTPATLNRWQSVFANLTAKHPSAAAITNDLAREWIKGSITPKRKAGTVRTTWLASTKLIFGWAVDEKLIATNHLRA
jgi:hypothetical protein